MSTDKGLHEANRRAALKFHQMKEEGKAKLFASFDFGIRPLPRSLPPSQEEAALPEETAFLKETDEIEPELEQYLVQWAKESGRSVTGMVRALIIEEIKRRREMEAAKAGRKN